MNVAVCMDTRVIIYGACLSTYVYFFFLYDIYLCNPLSVWEGSQPVHQMHGCVVYSEGSMCGWMFSFVIMRAVVMLGMILTCSRVCNGSNACCERGRSLKGGSDVGRLD